MVKIQLDLTEEESHAIEVYKAKHNLKAKAEAVLELMREKLKEQEAKE